MTEFGSIFSCVQQDISAHFDMQKTPFSGISQTESSVLVNSGCSDIIDQFLFNADQMTDGKKIS